MHQLVLQQVQILVQSLGEQTHLVRQQLTQLVRQQLAQQVRLELRH